MKSIIDVEFSEIKSLKWLPWIGDRFKDLDLNNRLFIVGESHYSKDIKQATGEHNSITLTREVIEEMAIEQCYYDTKIFQNLHKALFRNDEIDTTIFWNLISFYNFIQRPMVTNQERPNYDDFYCGWKTFFETVTVIKPKTCLFIGLESANSLEEAIEETDYTTDGVKYEDCISNSYARTAIIKDKENNEIKLVFIRHTSKYFSWSKWNEYLMKTIPKEITWLEKRLITTETP